MPPTTIAAALIKGGCGKSSLAWGLASFLSEEHPTLAIDLDPQATLTHALATDYSHTVYDVLQNQTSARDAVIPALPAYGKNLCVIPASSLLTNLEGATALDPNRQFMIADVIEQLGGHFDFIVLDVPAGQSLLTVAPLVVPGCVAVSPVATQPASYATVVEFGRTIAQVKKRLNPSLRWLLAANLFDGARQVLDREVLDVLRSEYGEQLVEPPIRKRVMIAEDMAAGRPCRHQDFELLTHNLLERIRHE